jgi:hypothetical protein
MNMTRTQAHEAEHEMLPPSQEERQRRNNSSRPRSSKIAITMACSLIIGILFALIHHFFYDYWNGRVVASESQQRWINRGGTAFAFGVKTALTIGTSTAFFQYFWLSVSTRDLRVDNINSLFKILGNILEFADVKLWWQLPVLTTVAVITWSVLVNHALRNR